MSATAGLGAVRKREPLLIQGLMEICLALLKTNVGLSIRAAGWETPDNPLISR